MSTSTELSATDPRPTRGALADPRLNLMFGRRDRRADLLAEQIDQLTDRIADLETRLRGGDLPMAACPECAGTGKTSTHWFDRDGNCNTAGDFRPCETCKGRGRISPMLADHLDRQGI